MPYFFFFNKVIKKVVTNDNFSKTYTPSSISFLARRCNLIQPANAIIKATINQIKLYSIVKISQPAIYPHTIEKRIVNIQNPTFV